MARLDEGLIRYLADTSDAQIRDGLIQRFEFTYDLATKMLRRALEATADTPDAIDRMTFPAMIRTANEQDLLPGDGSDWHGYRDMRTASPHSYDETKALQVAAAIPAFLKNARELVSRLQAHTALLNA